MLDVCDLTEFDRSQERATIPIFRPKRIRENYFLLSHTPRWRWGWENVNKHIIFKYST